MYENYAERRSLFLRPPERIDRLKDLGFFEDIGKNKTRDIMPIYIMYDQEPLFDYALTTYKYRIRWGVRKHEHHILDRASLGELLGCSLFSGHFPIWCHSEKNSDEISDLERNLSIPCYYWYHAFVSRDWFRYWQNHRRLEVQDKSRATYRFLLYARDHTGSREYRKNLIKQLEVYKDDILYDWSGTKSVDASYSAMIDIEDSNLAGIHLVSETLFYTNKIHLTEKVFKPMVMSQPFIIWAAPGTLAYLKDYGFQTFEHIWSEAYDNEQDHGCRMQMLVELVKSLHSLSAEEYQILYQKCLPIIAHNRKRFFSSEFMDHCWKELETNWMVAKDTRDRLLEELPGGQFINILDRNPDLGSLSWYQTLLSNLVDKMDTTTRDTIRSRYPQFSDLL